MVPSPWGNIAPATTAAESFRHGRASAPKLNTGAEFRAIIGQAATKVANQWQTRHSANPMAGSKRDIDELSAA